MIVDVQMCIINILSSRESYGCVYVVTLQNTHRHHVNMYLLFIIITIIIIIFIFAV